MGLFNKIKKNFEVQVLTLKKSTSLLFEGLDKKDAHTMSIFNMSIWKVRNLVENCTINSAEGCFLGVFKHFRYIYE